LGHGERELLTPSSYIKVKELEGIGNILVSVRKAGGRQEWEEGLYRPLCN
jgi:hypothetical protein